MSTLLMMAAAALTIAASDQPVERSASAEAKLRFTVTAASKVSSPAVRYFEVNSSADSDGDGVGDALLLKVACDGGRATDAAYQSRDAPSGLSSGKRQHRPVTFVKEWDKASPLLGKTAGYDLKANVKARTSGSPPPSGWTEVELARNHQLCT